MPPPLRAALPLAAAVAALAALACGRDPAPAPPAATTAPAAAAPPARERPPPRPRERAAPAGATAAAPSRPPCPDPGAGPDVDGRGLQAFVKKRTRAVRDCYDQALKRNADLRGRFVVRFTVGTCGEVQDLAFRGSPPPRELAACVERSVRSWNLPFRPAEPVEVEYPFAFTAR